MTLTDFQITEAGEYEDQYRSRWVVTGRCGHYWAGHLKDQEGHARFFRDNGETRKGDEWPLVRRVLPEKTVWVVLGHDANCGFNLDGIWIEAVETNREDADAAARSIGARYRGTLTGTITIPDGGGE